MNFPNDSKIIHDLCTLDTILASTHTQIQGQLCAHFNSFYIYILYLTLSDLSRWPLASVSN